MVPAFVEEMEHRVDPLLVPPVVTWPDALLVGAGDVSEELSARMPSDAAGTGMETRAQRSAGQATRHGASHGISPTGTASLRQLLKPWSGQPARTGLRKAPQASQAGATRLNAAGLRAAPYGATRHGT